MQHSTSSASDAATVAEHTVAEHGESSLDHARKHMTDRYMLVQSSVGDLLPEREGKYKFRFAKEWPIRISTTWEASWKKTRETMSFLDLPKEIRDMIYREVCDQIPRYGQALPRADTGGKAQVEVELEQCSEWKKEEERWREHLKSDAVRKTMVTKLSLLRTCHQIHAEFAEMLYALPLQIKARRSYQMRILELTSTYAHFVKNVFVLMAGQHSCAPQESWRRVLQITTSLSPMFPNLSILRVAWDHDFGGRFRARRHLRSENVYKWAPFDLRAPHFQESDVERCEVAMRGYCELMDIDPAVPPYFELIRIVGDNRRVETTFTQAARRFRSKPPST